MRSFLKNKNNVFIMSLFAILLIQPLVWRKLTYVLLIFNYVGIYVVAATGLDLLLGYSGQISMGQAGFYAIGAYTSALLSIHIHIPVIFTMFIGASLAALVGIILAYPASKLVFHFLSLATIAFGEIVYQLCIRAPGDITRGFQGLIGIPSLSFFGVRFNTYSRYFYFLLAVVTICLLLKARIINSRTGRAFVAIRENAHAANGMGINVQEHKVLAFGIASFMTGLAGALYAHLVFFISPETFSSDTSVMFLTMVLFGGIGTYLGPVLGAVAVICIREFLQYLGVYYMLIYGIFILISLMFLPKGVVSLLPKMKKVKKDAA
ncbi:MAG: branched-chain amino acid ABC transporter permease [Synergistaceae bacterium]|jgi:branched-chain amino acid transport system permease protein|nr:branched-chain amino acid ABC transporter permease [Synergistaceae bacterium]